AVADARRTLSADDPRLANILASLGGTLLKVQQAAEAEKVLRECLAIRERNEPDAWTTFNAKSMLGGALLGQEKYADAEPLLVEGYEGMKQRQAKIPKEGQAAVSEALERLTQLYEAWGKPEPCASNSLIACSVSPSAD